MLVTVLFVDVIELASDELFVVIALDNVSNLVAAELLFEVTVL